MVNPIFTANMNEHQRAWFFAEYQHASKDEVVGVLLALFLGGFGIHKFYLGQTGAGVLYLVFSWTGIPAIVGFIECFFMPGRVKAYNAGQAQYIANGILAASGQLPINVGFAPLQPAEYVAISIACLECGEAMEKQAAFCPHCGATVAAKPANSVPS